MPSKANTDFERAAKQVRAAAIDGVVGVLTDPDEATIWLICEPGSDAHTASLEAAAVAGDVPVRTALQTGAGSRGRVRMLSATCVARGERSRRAEVTLEWEGNRVTAETVGEPGTAMELRLVAEAALEALHRLRPDTEDVRLVGVKPTRAFDADLMVASLYRSSASNQRLVGAVLAGDDPHRAAAAAVLGALNRLLGNYLSTR